MFPPIVVEKSGRNEYSYDIYSRLLKDRVIFLGTAIDDQVASCIIAQLLYLYNSDPKGEINFYIMSPGGEVNAGLAIYDTMQYLTNDIATYCVGHASSMASLLLAAGTPGKRFALRSARVMIHQPWGHVVGDASSIVIEAKEILHLKQMISLRLAKHTGKNLLQVEKDCDRDYYLSAEEAKEYGLIDKILKNAREGRHGVKP